MESAAASEKILGPYDAEALLVFVLRFGGGVLLLAFGAMFLPTAWMSWSHERMGLGPLPQSPVFEYLARSISGLYACRGLVYWRLAADLRRYAPLTTLFGWLDIALGIALLGIDLEAGMPWWWTAGEGPGLVAVGVILVWLGRRVEREARWSTGDA